MKNLFNLSSKFWVVILIPLFLLECTSEKPVNNEEVRTEIRNHWDKFITFWESEDTENLIMMYTEDAVNIPPNSKPKKGRSEILEFYEFLFSNNKSSKYNHRIISLESGTNYAIEHGEFEVEWTGNDDMIWTYKARIVAHWKRNKGGDWQIGLVIFNQPPEVENQG